MPNQYVEFVRQWAKDHGLSYMCSIGNPNLKSDYLKFKAGESYGKEMDFEPAPKKKSEPKIFEITPAPKKKKVEQEFEIEVNPRKKVAKQTKERSSMGSEDINVARPKPRVNINELINKLEKIRDKAKQTRDRSSMGSEDKNVAVKKTGSEKKIKKYIEKLNKIKDEIYNINLREDAVMVKINASKNPSDILTKQAKNLRKKYIELNTEVENIVDEIRKLK